MFVSPGASDRIRTLDRRIMSQMFYHFATADGPKQTVICSCKMFVISTIGVNCMNISKHADYGLIY
jgi:hypothetical protein